MKKSFLCLLVVLSIFSLGMSGCMGKKEEMKNKQGTYQVIDKMNLEQIEIKNFKTMAFTKEQLLFSPDNQYLAVGTEEGRIFLYDLVKKKIVWEKKMGIGSVLSMVFSLDGKRIFLGEQSPEGNIYCLDASDGRQLWKKSTEKELGNDLRKRIFPQVLRLALDKKRQLYASAVLIEKRGNENYYQGKIYCLNADDGKAKWTFPKKGTGDFYSNWLSISPQQDQLLFARNFSWHAGDYIYCLETRKGEISWKTSFSVLPAEKRVSVRGPNFSSDGKNVITFLVDGRTFCLDNKGQTVWKKDVCLPKEIQGVNLHSGGRQAYWWGKQIFLVTMNTYNSHGREEEVPIEHPNGNSIFVYSPEGKLLWKWKAGGDIGELEYNDNYLLVPVGRNVQLEDGSVHGIYLLNPEKKGKVVYNYHTKGPVIAVALSKNSQYLACLEAPIKMNDNVTIIGQHQLHILKKN